MAGATARETQTALADSPDRLPARVDARVVLAAVAIATFVVQAPVLGHYFFGDDFVPLADIAARGTVEYVKDLFLLQDVTPNWRFLTGLYYLVAFEAFGLNATPYLLGSVVAHTGTAGLVFHFMRRSTGQLWVAAVAGLLFGLTPASVPTVGQVTAANNVFGGFFLMLSVVAVYEAFEGRSMKLWLAGAAVAFAAAIAANDSLAVLAPVPALVALWRSTYVGSSALLSLRSVAVLLPFAVVGSAALVGFGACECTEAADGGTYGFGSHIVDNVFIYLGRLLYPIGMEPLGDVGTTHLLAGIAVVALAIAALVRGPMLARFAVLFLVLALIPYLPLKLWSAPRYVYLASIPFSMLAALYVAELARVGRVLAPFARPSLALLVVAVLGWYGWQTWSQNEDFDQLTRDWEALVAGVEAAVPELPPESTVYVRGGAIVDPLQQCVVMPSVGGVLWGDAKLFTLPADDMAYAARPGYSVVLLDVVNGEYAPAELPVAGGDGAVTLLPHVPPEAGGNLCLDGVPGFP